MMGHITTGGGASSWTELDDTPASITALEFVRGNVGGTALEFVALSGIDHGGLGGLADNDHPQYPLKASTETISGAWTFSAPVVITATGDALKISNVAPRIVLEDTTPTNGDTWQWQIANNNARIRNISNSDGELRIEEKLDLNRQYDPSPSGPSVVGIISFDPSYTFDTSFYTENMVDLSPNVSIEGSATGSNVTVLRGGGSYTYDIVGANVWSLFRASPVLSHTVNNSSLPSPSFFDCQGTVLGGEGVTNLIIQAVASFNDRINIAANDAASSVLLINEMIGFWSQPFGVVDDAGIYTITARYGFKCDDFDSGTDVAAQYGFYCESFGSNAANNFSIFTGNGICEFGGAINHLTTVTAAATLSITRGHHSIFGSLAGNQTFTLPDCTVADTFGRKYNIKKTGASGTLTVDTTSSQTIDGALTATLTIQYESITLRTDGVEWFVI